MTIPRVIHRIWIHGSPPASPRMVANGVAWAAMNPEWTVRLWSGPTFRMKNSCLWRRPPNADALRYWADLLRLEILLREGGLYVDMDVIPLRPLGDLLDGHGAVAAYSPNRWKGERVLSNAIMAAEPGHPWISRCVGQMRVSVQKFRGQFLAMMTGPHHVNRCLRPDDGVTVMEPETFYPMDGSQYRDAYTFHSWENRAKLDPREVAAR